jgi:hypothetical protein
MPLGSSPTEIACRSLILVKAESYDFASQVPVFVALAGVSMLFNLGRYAARSMEISGTARRNVLIRSAPRRGVTRATPSLTSLQLSTRLCAAGTATSNMLTGSHSRHSMALFAVGCGRCCAGRSTDRVKDTADAITNNGQMLSSLTLGCSRCMRPTAWRANPDVETTDWRVRRGRTAQRVRREGTAIAVPYPYPPTRSGHPSPSGWVARGH